jgi:predicted glutamine amidotransferase
MCLLITQPAGTVFTDEFLRGVFNKNQDGLGVMYAENNTLYTAKILPKTYAEAKAFYDEHISGRACAIHWRMQTHGHIDLHNCHPYEVISEAEGYPLWLMHNGILHTDNKKDMAKSDTWHYIQDYLRPMLLKNPEWFMSPEFNELVGRHIGSNRFTLLDAYGNMVTINERQGVQYNGAWLSNTYAWETRGTEHDVMARGMNAANSWRYDDYDRWDLGTPAKVLPFSRDLKADIDECEEWIDTFTNYLESLYTTDPLDNFTSLAELSAYFYTVGADEAWYLLDIIDEGNLSLSELLDAIEYKTPVSALLEDGVPEHEVFGDLA